MASVAPPAAPAGAAPGVASLELYKDGALVRTMPLVGASEWIVGRKSDADLIINHSSISRRHARVYEEDGGFYIDDLNSAHGTLVSGQRLAPAAPVRLFDGLRVDVAHSGYELVPRNTMAAVMAKMRAAQAEVLRKEKERQEAQDAEDDEAAGVESGPVAPGQAATGARAVVEYAAEEQGEEEDEEMRAFLPMNFGKVQEPKDQSLEKQHAMFARGSDKIAVEKKKKKGTITFGAISTKVGAGAGMAVPAATPTLAALQEAREKEGKTKNGREKEVAPPPKQLGASLPERPPEEPVDDEDEVGPQLPPGFQPAADAGEGQEAQADGNGSEEEKDGEKDEEDLIGPPMPKDAGATSAEGSQEPQVYEQVRHFNDLDKLDRQAKRAYDPNDLSQQVMGGDDDEEEEDDDGQVRLPVSHQVALKSHKKCVTCLALDRAGARLITGSSDNDLYFWDFAGMTQELRPFRHVEEPLGAYQLRAIDYSPTAQRIIVAGSSSQPCIYDRDGRKLGTMMKGDMYIRDMRHTRGHVAGCTAASWHPTDSNTVATASEDGTLRLWDVEVALERGDDAMSLNVNSGQKLVAVMKDSGGHKKCAATSCAWHRDGSTIMCGAKDGSLQLWELRAPEYKPVQLLLNAAPKQEFRASDVKARQIARGAHAPGEDISCVRWHRDGFQVASRSTDGALKLWDIRKFQAPLADWGGLEALMPMVGCDFSPDQSMLVTGTAVRKGAGTAKLHFFSTRTLEKVGHVDVDGASVVPVIWHPRLNQIILGNADGNTYVLYDPDMSEKGVMYCSTKQAPKRTSMSYTGNAMHVITPHALPMFRDENLDHRKKRKLDRKDPLKSRMPEQVQSGPSTGGKLQVGYQQALLASLPGGVSGVTGTKDKINAFLTEDPREALLRYHDDVVPEEKKFYAVGGPNSTYAKNQPDVVAGKHLAKAVSSDEEEET